MKRYFQFFVTGLTTLLPLSLTLYVVYKGFRMIDNVFGWIIERILGYPIIGLGFVLTIIFITAFGMLAKTYLTQSIMSYIERVALRIPIIQVIYGSIKEISSLVTEKDMRRFTEVVSVKFPNPDTTSIGFVTKNNILMDDEEKVCVFIPTTPNPSNGFLIFVDKNMVHHLDMSIDQAIKSIVSMGAITPDILDKKQSRS
jgi:uncharacterized membrane protein